jgi:hypothetical protein
MTSGILSITQQDHSGSAQNAPDQQLDGEARSQKIWVAIAACLQPRSQPSWLVEGAGFDATARVTESTRSRNL